VDQIASRIREILAFGIPGTPLTVGRLVTLAALLALLLYVNRRFTRWVVESFLARRHIDIGVAQAVGTLLRYAITVVGVIVILQAVGIELSALTVLAGAVGVGLGFGLQNIASNFVSGLIILFERPIKVGDVRVKVPWDADAELVKRLLLEAATDHPNVLRDPAPEVELRDLRAGLQFSLQVWSTQHVQGEGRLKSDLNFAIREKLHAHDIPIATLRGEAAGGSR
jgi:small-conductance mechanosensitive channel